VPEVGVEPAVQERIDSRRAESYRLEQHVDELEVRSADALVEELGEQRVHVPRRPTDDEHGDDAGQNACRYVSTTSSCTTSVKDCYGNSLQLVAYFATNTTFSNFMV